MKTSIVTVCFNSAKTLPATLASVARQKNADIQHIVVDGGSTDGTIELIQGCRSHEIVYLPGPDHGIYDAMNKGMMAATGDILGFLNSDDRYFNDDVVQSITSRFDSKIDWVYGDLTLVDPTSRSVRRYWESGAHSAASYGTGWLPPHPTLYVRKGVAMELGAFDLRYKVAADIDWMLRLLRAHKHSSAYIPQVLVEMDSGGQSNEGVGAIIKSNMDVMRICARQGIFGPLFIAGKLSRKIPQLFRRPRHE